MTARTAGTAGATRTTGTPTSAHLDHAHRRAVFLHALLAGHHHCVVGRQPLKHLYLARAAHAQLDFHPLRDFAFGAVHQLEHKLPTALGHDGFLRNDLGFLACAKHRAHARKHARAQLHAPVVNAGTHAQRATVGVNQGVYGLHHSLKFTARQGVHIDLGHLPTANLGLKAFGQAVVHEHGVNVFQVHHLGAILEVVAQVDLAYTHRAVKWGQNTQACGRGLGQRQLGIGHLEVGCALVHGAAADEVLLDQFAVAVEVALRNRQLGLGLLDLSGRQLVVELHQELPLAHAVAIAEVELSDAAANFGLDDHPLARAQTAHGLDIVHQPEHLHLGHFHGGLAATWAPACTTRTCRRSTTGWGRPNCAIWGLGGRPRLIPISTRPHRQHRHQSSCSDHQF